jgi:hypothetical protein
MCDDDDDDDDESSESSFFMNCGVLEAVLVKKRKLAKKKHKYHKFIIQRVSAWKFFVYSSSVIINPLS